MRECPKPLNLLCKLFPKGCLTQPQSLFQKNSVSTTFTGGRGWDSTLPRPPLEGCIQCKTCSCCPSSAAGPSPHSCSELFENRPSSPWVCDNVFRSHTHGLGVSAAELCLPLRARGTAAVGDNGKVWPLCYSCTSATTNCSEFLTLQIMLEVLQIFWKKIHDRWDFCCGKTGDLVSKRTIFYLVSSCWLPYLR